MFLLDEDTDAKKKEAEKNRAVKLAKFYKEEGLYEDAIKNFELYIFLSGEQDIDYHLYKDLAICYSLSGLTAEAINNLKKALKYNNKDISLMYLLAQMYEQSGMYEEAEFHYKEITKIDEKMASVYYQLGEIAYKKGNIEAAIKNWNNVIVLEPTNSYAHYLLGSLYYYKKDYKNAEENFKAALKNGFKSAQLYNYLGKLYAKFGEHEKSKLNFLIAIDRDKTNNVIYENYLNLLDDDEKKHEEEKLYGFEEEELNRFRLGILYKVTGNYMKSKEIFEQLKKDKVDSNIKIKVEAMLDEIIENMG